MKNFTAAFLKDLGAAVGSLVTFCTSGGPPAIPEYELRSADIDRAEADRQYRVSIGRIDPEETGLYAAGSMLRNMQHEQRLRRDYRIATCTHLQLISGAVDTMNKHRAVIEMRLGRMDR